jgi:hypothetical protein
MRSKMLQRPLRLLKTIQMWIRVKMNIGGDDLYSTAHNWDPMSFYADCFQSISSLPEPK